MTDTTQNASPAAVHPFERAGLGKAPFRFVGHEHRVFQAIPGDPNCPLQAGGSCEYCGQAISEFMHIVSADGQRHHVGADCIRKINDPGLAAGIRKAARQARHAREAAKADSARASLADPAVRAKLAAMPHPAEWAAKAGKTLADWADWMLGHAGAAGKVKVERAIRAALAQ